MPSPIAHGMAGLAMAWAFRTSTSEEPVSGRIPRDRSYVGLVAAALFAAGAADLDFLPGLLIGAPGTYHHAATHSLGAAVIFGALVFLVARWVGSPSPRRLAVFLGLVYGSHVVLDLLTADFGTQIGLPLWWPISTGNVISPVHLFIYIKRGPATDTFISSQLNLHNAYAVMREIAVMGMILLSAWLGQSALSKLWGRKSDRMEEESAV